MSTLETLLLLLLRCMPSADSHARGISVMPSLIGVALITVGLGFLLVVPCIIETTPITMCLFSFSAFRCLR